MPQQDGVTSKKIWIPFTINISMVILLIILGIFIGFFINNKRLIEAELETRARAHFNNIVLTRHWNATYGGVYVEKREGVISNPYLKNPDITSIDGTVYTKKNPALMTREISELADHDGSYTFHITSLKPLNPGNKPDAFESRSLRLFEQGEKEVFLKEDQQDGKVFFRYMGPLVTEKSCLDCHGEQGYKVGDVRGGISIRFDIDDIEKALLVNRALLITLFLVTVVLLLGSIYLQIVLLYRRLRTAQDKIKKMAITDELTGLYNRRYFFERLEAESNRSVRHNHTLGLILFDLDYFKRINDTYGHNGGDAILRQIAEILRAACRQSDIPARYGGEEFILLLPECNEECVEATAEKLRRLMESHPFISDENIEIKVTASFGVATFSSEALSEKPSSSEMVKKADTALYRAKKGGRNRVEKF